MAEEPYDDQEYQFNEAEDALYEQETNAKPAAAATGPAKKSSMKKFIIVLVILGALVFVLYKGMSILTIHNIKPAPVKALPAALPIKQKPPVHPFMNPVQQAPVASVTTTPPANISHSAILGDNFVKKDENNDEKMNIDRKETSKNYENLVTMLKNSTTINEELSKTVKQSQETDQERLNALEAKLGALEENLKEIQTGVKDVSAGIQNNQALQKKLDVYEKKAAADRSADIRKKKQYYVEAVVPGRAWLKAADNTVETVAVGDDLAGYGKITAIDPYSGAVETSTGGSLYYGLDSH